MSTFSQIVDEMYKELIRPDLRDSIVVYLNQSVREIHFHAQTNMPVFFDDNRMEAEVTLSAVNPVTGVFLWDVPSMPHFQRLEAIYYERWKRYAIEKKPNIARLSNTNAIAQDFYYYRSGPQIALANPGNDGDKVQISWLEYPRSLKYYAGGTSPAIYDESTDSYMPNPLYTGPAMTLDEAIAASTNWILQRHTLMIKEGVRAKVFNRIDEASRAGRYYSSYQALRMSLQNTESVELNPTYFGS